MEQYEKRGYLLEKFRLFHLRTAEAPGVDMHYHAFCKVLLLVSGSGSYVVEGQRYSLRPGDAVLIGSRCVHKPELAADTPYERIIIYIDPEFLRLSSTPDCLLESCFAGGPVLRLKEPQRKRLFDMAADLEKEMGAAKYGHDIASSALLLRLMVQLCRDIRRTDAQNPSPVQPENDRVLDMMRYLDSHLEEDLNIDALAERFYISKFHMMRLFRRETGYTVYEYLSQRRLLHARMLMEGGMRATEACYRSGFRSYSSFTRSYSKHFGSTPTGRVDAAHRRAEDYE